MHADQVAADLPTCRVLLAQLEVPVDVAFIAAPCCDETGNLNGVSGPSACGSLGYAFTDARYARKVIAVTDNLVRLSVGVEETSDLFDDLDQALRRGHNA